MTAFLQDLAQFNAPTDFVRATVTRFPNSSIAKQKASLPLGMVLQPLASGVEVPSVDMGHIGILRCTQCKTYLNPFVRWESGGRTWSCNLCGFSQTTRDNFYANLDETGRRVDRYEKECLSRGSIEYVAPAEYMVRPPQPPVFFFAIDVSYAAVASGMLHSVVAGIKEALQAGIPNGDRLQIGIMTYDTTLHFYSLTTSSPQMLVVADLEDIFLPLAEGILVSAAENSSALLGLLDQLPEIFRDTTVNETCLGSAVRGAHLAMKHIGGKLIVCGACIPSVGTCPLKSSRENPRLLGTEREVEALRPVSDMYKDLAAELTKAQISADLFLAPQAYVDLASIAPLAEFSGGEVRFYDAFNYQLHGVKLMSEIQHTLTRYTGWEAMMRVRVSRGWKITGMYGHHQRNGDLLIIPVCTSDQTFAVTFDIDENSMPQARICIQSALLYTNSEGERRIRVHTWSALTTEVSADVVNSVDVQATISVISSVTLSQSLKVSLSDGRNKLQQQCQQIVSSGHFNAESLQFLPLYILGMLKSPAFRATNDQGADLRTFIFSRLASLPPSQVSAFFYPRLLSLHDMADTCGLPDETGSIALPGMLSLTSASLTQDGIYLLDNGESILFWIGGAADVNFLQCVFGMPSFDQFDSNAAGSTVATQGNPLSNRVDQIIQQVRADRSVPFLAVQVVRQGEPLETKFFASLIEDRTAGFQTTYAEFLQRMGYRPQGQQPQGAQSAPPMMTMGR